MGTLVTTQQNTKCDQHLSNAVNKHFSNILMILMTTVFVAFFLL